MILGKIKLDGDKLLIADDGSIVFRNRMEIRQRDKNGYRVVSIKGKSIYVHRLVGFVFIPNPKKYPQINHKNGIKNDNRVENLEWCTHFQNMRHATLNGLRKTREQHPSAKLDWKKVKYIRKSPLSAYQLAKEFLVSRETIRDVRNGRNWNLE